MFTEFRPRSNPKYLRSECKACNIARCSEYAKRPDSTVFWNKLAYNLKRHGKGRISATELRTDIGEPQVCYLCGGNVTRQDAELDHVQPLSQNGRTEPNNLKWAHHLCNRMKGPRTVDELMERIERIFRKPAGMRVKPHARIRMFEIARFQRIGAVNASVAETATA